MDEGIHALAQRKLKLDAAVLQGVTATGADNQQRGRKKDASDTMQVCFLLCCSLSTCSPCQWLCSLRLRAVLQIIPVARVSPGGKYACARTTA